MIPFVLIPGLLCSAEIFTPQIPALWPYGSVTIASTLNGDSLSEIARSILDAAPPRFALAGISMGGYISLEIMRQASDRVVKLALLSTSARSDTPAQIMSREAMVGQAGLDFPSFAAAACRVIVHPERADDEELRQTNARMATSIGYEAFARHVRAIAGRPDSRAILPTIRVPTLVLVGEEDPLTPQELSIELASAIPGAELVVIPRCGHEVTLEQPDLVNSAITKWATAPIS